MRRALPFLFVFGVALHSGTSLAQPNVQLVQDGTKPDGTGPSTQLPPDTEVIKPKADPDPKIEKAPPDPDPDPANKDVIKPPSNIQPK
jgi:hypothetical protein